MVGIIVKGRDRIVRHQKDLINQVNKNIGRGFDGSSKQQRQRIRDFKDASIGLPRRTEM